MIELNYDDQVDEITQKLAQINQITLATCTDNRVLARTVCPINDRSRRNIQRNTLNSVRYIQLNPTILL